MLRVINMIKNIIKIALIMCTLLPTPLYAWNAHTHSKITEISLKSVAKSWGLLSPVTVTSLDSCLKNIGVSKRDFAKIASNDKIGTTIQPLQILLSSSVTAKEESDINHIEKPILNVFASSTWSWPPTQVGVASEMVNKYLQIASSAKRVGNSYCAWFFLGEALIYATDLAQPYHTVQFNSHGKYIWLIFNNWINNDLSFTEVSNRVMNNSHIWYENIIDNHLRILQEDVAMDARANLLIKKMHGDSIDPVVNILSYAKNIRDNSNRMGPDLLQAVYYLTNDKLHSLIKYGPNDPPELYFRRSEDSRYILAENKFFELSTNALNNAAKTTRTLVKWLIDQK